MTTAELARICREVATDCETNQLAYALGKTRAGDVNGLPCCVLGHVLARASRRVSPETNVLTDICLLTERAFPATSHPVRQAVGAVIRANDCSHAEQERRTAVNTPLRNLATALEAWTLDS